MSASAPAQQDYGHYVVEQELGRGAMGTVYLARDRRIGRRVALKTINLTQQRFEDSSSAKAYLERLQREAELCGSLVHPNIVTLYEPGYHGERIVFLAIEYVEGETLLQLLKRHRPDPLPQDVAIRIARDVLGGLAHAHARGIIHRDIKPANILLNAEGVAKIADFGIARPQNSSMTAAGAMMGTPNYMSPEQVIGRPLTPRADIFSLGVMLYEMLTGTKPFAAADVTVVLHNIVRHIPPPVAEINPAVSPWLSDLVSTMISKNAVDRPTASEALARLETANKTPSSDAVWAPAGGGLWLRPIKASQAVMIILLSLAAAVIPSAIIASRIDASPTVTIPPQQLEEFARKRSAMAAADQFFREGKYGESLVAYEGYLRLYPHSTAAREGVERARGALQNADQSTQSARRPTRPQQKPLIDDIKTSVKRLFRGD